MQNRTVPLFLLGLLLLVIGSVTAQQLLPLPRASIELLSNGGFEMDTDSDKLPDGWSGKNTSAIKADKLKCDKPDKPVAHSGTCTLMFRGNSDGTTSKIQQKISDTSTIVNGVEVSFSVYLDTRSGVPGATIGKAKIKYSDATSTKFSLVIPAAGLRGVEDYQQVSDTQTISIGEGVTISKVKVDFRYKESSGKFLIDDASFAVITADPTATPTDSVVATDTLSPTLTATDPVITLTPTDELSATATDAATDTPTDVPTESDTATNTELPTDVPTATATSTATPTNTQTSTATPTPLPPPVQIIATDGAANDSFGGSVALSGDTMAIGAFSDVNMGIFTGSAYVYIRSGSTWVMQQKLLASDPGSNDLFGGSIAIDGDTLVVGAYQDNDMGSDSGSVYVFTRSGTTWTQQQKLVPSDGAAFDYFGTKVSISGDTLIVSASQHDSLALNAGAVYIYTRSGGVWSLQQKLTANDGAADDNFGNSAAIDGDTVVVGASQDDDIGSNSGSAYIYTRSGGVWSLQQKFAASDGAAGDSFGVSAAIDGDTVVIGAFYADAPGVDSGAVYVFTRSGTVWTQQQKLTASDGTPDDTFGISIALHGNRVVIGADNDDQIAPDAGSAYAFVRSGTVWTQQQKLTAPDAAANDLFGFRVGLYDGTAVVGSHRDDIGANANQGSVWVFGLP